MPPVAGSGAACHHRTMFTKRETINWGDRSLVAPTRSRLQCGHLLVEFSRGENEVCLASKRLSDEEADLPSDRDEPVVWTDWAVCTGNSGVQVLPGLPDRSVLAKQDPPFQLLPGREVRVFLRIPVSVQVRLDDSEDEPLAEFPTELLPQTWFGEADRAEPCYRLPSPVAREALRDLDSGEIQAPVLIRNESREVLTVTQICLRVARLSIYRSGDSLWTNETVARYQGGIHPSRLTIKSGPPPEAPAARLLVEPRENGPLTMVGRTFRSFRRWTMDWR